MKQDDFLVEIHTEELPPNALKKMAEAFHQQITERLGKAGLAYASSKLFATPRRLAVFVEKLQVAQPDQQVEKRGPALAAAFDAGGKPTPACQGFARSCGVTPDELMTLKTPQGEWVAYHQQVQGKHAVELLPAMVKEAIDALPVPKRMRWADKETQFSRPVHTVVMLYGDQVIDADILGCQTGRVTHGHRFMAPEAITLPCASAYESLLETQGYVIADVSKRREKVAALAMAAVKAVDKNAHPHMTDLLLDEVAGLVEWPVALCGKFDAAFLQVPKEVLISSMQDHQRYFPVLDAKNNLLPYFIATSNIQSHDPTRVIHGNERVLRARLSDAAFFFEADKKTSLASRLDSLKGIVFQAKLGTLHDKAERLASLAGFLAAKIDGDAAQAERAGRLAKTDLVTDMVGEFPELQGVMGEYYAKHDGEPAALAVALGEQYLPRFAGDRLPETVTGQALALADRLDTLVGTFGINQIPTGDKDPYGLRRAALGVLRILIEQKIDLDLKEAIAHAQSVYQVTLENKETASQVLQFMLERLRAWYQDQGVTADVFASVAALGVSNPLDIDHRIKAVQAFRLLTEAEALSIANKRVSNILSKYIDSKASHIDAALFENDAEKELAAQIDLKAGQIVSLSAGGHYERVLKELAGLRKPVDDFFDQVMVMTDDMPRRENRLRLLSRLRALFLRVADIALLQ